MTKSQLISALEPFENDIEINCYKEGYFFNLRMFYNLNYDGDGQIILAPEKPALNKLVEIKL